MNGTKKEPNSSNQQSSKHEIRLGQSIELLKELHILTRDGKLNQDSCRKLKQVYHLYQFIEPLLQEIQRDTAGVQLVDHGAGKSYHLTTNRILSVSKPVKNWSINRRNWRSDWIFQGCRFSICRWQSPITSAQLPARIDVVTALRGCNTATDGAIEFGLKKQARFMVLVPCCQAEVAAVLKRNKGKSLGKEALTEIWRHPLHTREFGSQVTNVLRCLQLEAHGY